MIDQFIYIGPGEDFLPHALPNLIRKFMRFIISKIRSKIRLLT